MGAEGRNVIMSDTFDDAAREPHENEEVPREDIAATAPTLQPETQGDEPEEAWLGEDGQGDISPEDQPARTEDDGDGPDDLRVEVDDLP